MTARETDDDTAYEVDTELRESMKAPIVNGDGASITLEDFPSDEDVLARVRAQEHSAGWKNHCIREFGLYRRDEKAVEDRPLKTDDHAIDDTRYFVRVAFQPSRFSF